MVKNWNLKERRIYSKNPALGVVEVRNRVSCRHRSPGLLRGRKSLRKEDHERRKNLYGLVRHSQIPGPKGEVKKVLAEKSNFGQLWSSTIAGKDGTETWGTVKKEM